MASLLTYHAYRGEGSTWADPRDREPVTRIERRSTQAPISQWGST